MQHVNDDNMDDLFNKSAEDYPLRINSSDWEKLAARWEEQAAGVAKKSDGLRKKNLLALSVFLFLGTASLLFVFDKIIKKDKHETAVKLVKRNSAYTSSNNGMKSSSQNSFQAIDDKTENRIDHRSKIAVSNAMNKRIIKNPDMGNQDRADESFNRRISLRNMEGALLHGTSNISDQEPDVFLKRYQSFPLADVLSVKNANKISNLQIEAAAIKTTIENKSNLPIRTGSFSKKAFYVGATLGPEINQVKSQGFNGVTGHLGVIAGYNFNSHFSLETGLLYSSKKYFSNGQYFNTEKIISAMPAGMDLMSLNSNLGFLEIPLKAKWDLLNNKRSNVFASAGLTSALLLKEHNSYNAMVNGVPEKLIGNYQAMSEYFAAFLYVSAGYEKQLANRAVLRFEPYLQLPLRAVGQGSMSVLGAGLNVSVILGQKK